MTNWHEGEKGALVMGLKHGKYCLGCCWALMLVLFVVGVMNLAWVAALIQPTLIVAMGAVVLVLVLAVMLPIVTMNQLVR